MISITSTLTHRVALPEDAAAERHPTLILLHGRGADEEDLMGLAPFLDERLLLVAARAPFPFPYGGGYTWYDVGEVGIPEPRMFRESSERLAQFIDDVLAGYPVDPARLFLLGFSMGSVMSYAMALTRPALFRGVAANSGYIPENTHLTFRWQELSRVEFCVTHGIDDQVIPLAMAHRARELLGAANVRLFYREYPMGHQISEQSIADVAAWMAHLL